MKKTNYWDRLEEAKYKTKIFIDDLEDLKTEICDLIEEAEEQAETKDSETRLEQIEKHLKKFPFRLN